MKQLCLFLAITALPSLGFSQFIGDSVIVYVDQRIEIKVAVPDYTDLKSSDSVIFALKEFKRIIPEIENQLSSGNADLIKYSVGGSLTVEPGDPKIIYLNKDGQLTNTGFRDKAIITGEKYEIFIITSDIAKFADFAAANCFEKVVSMRP